MEKTFRWTFAHWDGFKGLYELAGGSIAGAQDLGISAENVAHTKMAPLDPNTPIPTGKPDTFVTDGLGDKSCEELLH
ncbi:hypothetical protein ACFL5O_07045 [Myxococcota bacterium]